jgi:NAD(P)-dependent dehydrogenase (short-subunit alcohol dehydrogenase family)
MGINMTTDKVVIITGASRGIGAATAKLFAQNGYAVCINFMTNDIAAKQLIPIRLFKHPNSSILSYTSL